MSEQTTVEGGAPSDSFPPPPPAAPAASAAADTSAVTAVTEADLKIFEIDNDSVNGTAVPPPSATSSVATERVKNTPASTTAVDDGESPVAAPPAASEASTANYNDGAQDDEASIHTEESVSTSSSASSSSSSTSSGNSTESSAESESSSSSEDPSEVGGVKINQIDDSDSEDEEEQSEDEDEKDDEQDDNGAGEEELEGEEEEDPEDAVLLKEQVQRAEKQASLSQKKNDNSLMYQDDEELAYEESFGGVSDMMMDDNHNDEQQQQPSSTKKNKSRKFDKRSKKGLGQDRASVRKMVGQKLRGKGRSGTSSNRRVQRMRRTGMDGGLDLERGDYENESSFSRSNNRPRGWTAHYKRRRIWYCCFSIILICVGISLLIYGVAKERTLAREKNANLDDMFYYDDDEYYDDEIFPTPGQSPSRPSTPGGMPSPSAPTLGDQSPIHTPQDIPDNLPTGMPTYSGTMIPTLSPTTKDTPIITLKPTEKNWEDDALLSFLKIAYADALNNPSVNADDSLLTEYEGALDPKIYADADDSAKSIQWRSYEYLSLRNDVLDTNKNILLMDQERILQIYALMCFYQNFGWNQEGSGECLWAGVTCRDIREDEHKDVLFPSANDLRVVALNVAGNGPIRKDKPPLEGELPLEMLFLTYLQTLDVSHNKMKGKIPKVAIQYWIDMKVLELNDNFFEGDIPTELGDLENLQKLTLHHNEFVGEMPTQVCSLRDESLHFLWADCSIMASTNSSKVACDDDCCTICFEGYDDDGGPSTGGTSPSSPSETTHVVQNDPGSALKTKLSDSSTDGGMSLMEITTPQFHAYSWLVEDSAGANYSDERLFQRYALATLYFSTMGVQWTKSDGWTTSLDECKWFGISGCDNADSGKIVIIELFGNNLEGTIPPELFTFIPNVIQLNLANNKLRGEIPSSIGSLTKINILELAENDLTGQIPSEMGLLYDADHIFLQSNQLVGEMPWSVCQLRTEKSLTLLWADCRGTNPRIKCSVKCCSTCFRSDLSTSSSSDSGNADSGGSIGGEDEQNSTEDSPASHNDEGGKILQVLKKMAPDNGVTLDDNSSPQYKAYSWLVEQNYEPESDILTLQRYALATFYFATSGVGWYNNTGWLTSDDECSWWGVSMCNQGNMVTDLELYENNLVGKIPIELSHLRMIEFIDLSGNDLYGEIPTELGWFEELESLSLDNNFLSGDVPSELGNIFTLQELYIQFNEFRGVIPQSICDLKPETIVSESSQTTGLDELWVDCGDDPPQVSCPENCCTKCFTIEDAEGGTSFPTFNPTGVPTSSPLEIPVLLEKPELRTFLMQHMDGFEDSLAVENNDSPQYQAYMWLANSGNLDELDEFQRVQRFGLVSFYLSTSVDRNWKISRRWQTDQSECGWHGITCDEDGRTVKEVSLPRNRMSGRLPPEIALIGLGGKLVKLDISGNQIGGAIPPQIGDLKNIEILDLRSNDFASKIPPEIGSLSKLTILELHSNSLSGDMPSEICALRSESLQQLSADCDAEDPLSQVTCSDACCTLCF